MALVQGIYDLGKPGREQTLYTNRPADAALIQENFVSAGQSRNAITFMDSTFRKAWNHEFQSRATRSYNPLATPTASETFPNLCAHRVNSDYRELLGFVL